MADDEGPPKGRRPRAGVLAERAAPRYRRQEDRRFDALMQEYSRSIAAEDSEIDRMLRVAAIGFSAAAAILFLIERSDVKSGEWVYWLAPIFITLLCDIIIFFLYRISFYTYY